MTSPRTLHLPLGLAGTEWEDGDLARLDECEKIVIGDHGSPREGLVPHGLRSLPKGLRVLHLQGAIDLADFPSLDHCTELETLDLRGASALGRLPQIGHLAKLDWLDLEDCASLAELPDAVLPGLEFLFLGGCVGLAHDELVRFLEALGAGGPPRLVELDLSRTRLRRLPNLRWTGYWEADGEQGESYDHATRWDSMRWLEKLDLHGCEDLTEIELPLAWLPNLRHLDVSGCRKLRELPALPMVQASPEHPQRVLQYLRVDGTGIESHAGSSIRPSHRREAEGIAETNRNAAEAFLALQHFGEPVPFPECRLMVLGNSMAGKSNVVNRILYGIEGEDPEGYVEPDGGRDRWRPRLGLDSTHPIHCPTWTVALGDYERPAQVHVWDYGGQHKYHRSHRIFAREGTLFLLVWRHPLSKLTREDEAREKELLGDEPVARTLEYWLDYVVASGACSRKELPERVLIVCTQSGGHFADGLNEEFDRELGKYAELELQPWVVESVELGEDGSPSAQQASARRAWHRFHGALRRRVADTIARDGDMLPGAFARVAARVARDRRAAEDERERIEDRRQGRTGEEPRLDTETFRRLALPEEAQWSELVAEEHGTAVETPDLRALTQALHDAGGLFWLQPPGRADERYVIVDQGLALEWVYLLLDPEESQNFQLNCRERGGWFGRNDLVATPRAARDPEPLFPLRWEEDRALSILKQCRLLRGEGERLLALEDALLPDYGSIVAELGARRRRWPEQRALVLGTKARAIGSDMFQDLRAWLVGELASRFDLSSTLRLYRGGFQVAVTESGQWRGIDPERRGGWPERFMLEAAWVAFDPRGYGGRVHVRLYAEAQEAADQIWQAIAGETGLLRSDTSPLRAEMGDDDGGSTPFLLLEAAAEGVAPVGISARGTNADAPRLHEELWKLDPPLPPFFYRGAETLREVADEHTEGVLGRLGASAILVLFLDRDYLEADPDRNRYCLEELAVALFRFDPANAGRLERRLSTVHVDLPSQCKRHAAKLNRNVGTPRADAARRTLLYAKTVRQDEVTNLIEVALGALHAALVVRCEPLGPLNHPLWYLKRELVAVLLEDGGLCEFTAVLGDTSAAIKDFDKLVERVKQEAHRIHG